MSGEQIAQAARALVERMQWCALATVAPSGEPALSYVPFARVQGGFGIAVSSLAAHTAHLLAHPRCALLIVGDLPPGGDPFARTRLSVDVLARPVDDETEAVAIWDALAQRHGPTAHVLRTLPDFTPFLLEPLHARVVLGFARAADLDPQDL